MGEGEQEFVCSSDSMRSEDIDNSTAYQQTGGASFSVSTHNSAAVVSGIPQRLGALPQDADALHKWNDSRHVGTSTAADPSEDENAQCNSKVPDATRTASEQSGSDCLRAEGTEIIAEGIASVLGPVMKEFDGRAEGALKSQGILASSIDRLTRELDKLLDDAPIPFIIQHAAKISGVRKRVLSLNSTLQCIQTRIDHIERMLSGQVFVAASGSSSQDSLRQVHTFTSKGLENSSSSQHGESLTNDQSEHDGPDSFETEHV